MSDLKELVALAQQLDAAKARVRSLTDELDDAKARQRDLEQEAIPQAMLEAGVTRFERVDGPPLKLEEKVAASISERNRERALSWLREHGFSGIIKASVQVPFDAAEHDIAEALGAQLGEQYPGTIFKETVHPATLKSFVKERLEKGEAIPMDVFGVHPYYVVKTD